MKKSSAIYFSLVSFIIGSILASLFVYFFIHIKEVEKIENNNKQTIESLNNEILKIKKINQQIEFNRLEKNKKLKNLINKINAKDYSKLTKSILLSKDKEYDNLLLGPISLDNKINENFEDDTDIKSLKEAFNDRTKAILNSAGYILKEKINKLNIKIMQKNLVLSETNKKLDITNSDLDKANIALKSLNGELINKNNLLQDSLAKLNTYKGELEKKNDALNKSMKEIKRYKEELEENKKRIKVLKGIEVELKKTKTDLETKLENGKLKVSFKGDILFNSGSHKLKEEGKMLIDKVFPILKANIEKNNIFIAGHTDNEKVKYNSQKKYDSNWDLSTYRAIEVVKYLTKKGISPKNITAAGFGEFRPIADNSTAEGKKKNRRVELYLTPKIIKRNSEK